MAARIYAQKKSEKEIKKNLCDVAKEEAQKMLIATTNAIMKIREIIHELMIMQQLNKRDVREITEIDNKEIIIAIFEEYEKETIKIVAKTRENEKTIFEKIIEEKTKFTKSLDLAQKIFWKQVNKNDRIFNNGIVNDYNNMHISRLMHLGKYWKNFCQKCSCFIVVTHMMEGVTGMMIGLIVNMVFIVFAN